MQRTIYYRTGKMQMLMKISVGFFLGILFGFMAAPFIEDSPVLSGYVMPLLDLAGKIFLRLLAMLIVPLVFCSLISGVTSIGDTKKLGRIGFKTVSLYLITTLIAIGIGWACAYIIKPGSSIDIPAGLHGTAARPQHMSDMILDMFPDNPVTSMVNANMLQIIIFAMFVGLACMIAGEAGKKAAEFFSKGAQVMNAVTRIVMEFAPYGVFALISTTAAQFGLTIIKPFAKLIGSMYLACAIHAIVIYSLMIILICQKSPLWFFKGIREAVITAFVTRSSSITLPVTLANVRENFGVSEAITSFVLPLGATVNMDGTAMYQVICALFVARAFNVELSLAAEAAVVFASLLASIGSAGVPGAGLIMLTMVLTSAGLPVEGVGLVAGIDVVLSAARTFLNVMGDAAVCVCVASSEGEELRG